MTWSPADTESNFNSIMHDCVSKHVRFKCVDPGYVIAIYQNRVHRTFVIDSRTVLEQCNDINHVMVMTWQQQMRDSVVVSKLSTKLHLPD